MGYKGLQTNKILQIVFALRSFKYLRYFILKALSSLIYQILGEYIYLAKEMTFSKKDTIAIQT